VNLALNGLTEKGYTPIEKLLKNTDDAFLLICSENKFDDKSKEQLSLKFPHKIHF